jgi:oligopeptide/dipeptide ABC transporter ATP-binding protein
MDTLLAVENLSICYRVSDRKAIRAVSEVSLELRRKERVGLVGESGCGKTTTGFAVLNLLPENARVMSGRMLFLGCDVFQMSARELRQYRWAKVSMVFQAAMNALDPVYRVGDQLMEVYRTHTASSRKDAWNRIHNLFDIVGLPRDRVASYPHQLSGGMKQRAVIALSLLCHPDLIIADEPTTGLDVIIQDQIMREMIELITSLELSMILISHDISVMSEVCDRMVVMYAGRMVEAGTRDEIFLEPAHPYTVGLIKAFPSVRGARRALGTIPGDTADLTESVPAGCLFAPRCPRAERMCVTTKPEAVRRSETHWTACHYGGEDTLGGLEFGGRGE